MKPSKGDHKTQPCWIAKRQAGWKLYKRI